MTETAERIVLASRPVGEPTLDNLRLEEFPVPQLGPGQSLLSSAKNWPSARQGF
jgi:NADPH-dependent curcumin reductase CurA